MSDGWYETIAAIGGLTVVTAVALVEGQIGIASVGVAALAGYIGAKGVSLSRSQQPPSP